MKLGEIFAQQQGDPIVGKEVEFRLIKTSPEGQQAYKIKGIFHILTELDRREALERATEALKAEYADKQNMPDQTTRVFEQKIWEMILCIYDPEDERKRLLDRDAMLFKKGLTIPMLNHLIQQYEKFVTDEYPELVSDQEFNDMVAEAGKK